MPSAITLSSSTIRTLATARTIVPGTGSFRVSNGDDLVKRFFREKPSEPRTKSRPWSPSRRPSRTTTEPTYDPSFDELRTGFTAAVSHELRTPLARILALLDTADLPGRRRARPDRQARAEVENAGALIDEILFLSELESGKEIVSLGHTTALPVLEQSSRDLDERRRARGRRGGRRGRPDVDLPLRPRMLRMVAENLAENAIRYAGHGATLHALDPARGRVRDARPPPTTAPASTRSAAAPLRALLPRPTPRARHAARASASRS